MKTDWKPRYILWDLDGTMVYWKSLFIISRVYLCYLKRLSTLVPITAAFLSTIRAYKRVLYNNTNESIDSLFLKTLSNSLRIPSGKLGKVSESMLDDGSLDTDIKNYIRVIPEAKILVGEIYQKNLFLQVGTTNPVMPSKFNIRRLVLAGYQKEWFTHVTGSENYSRQKKHSQFYLELLEHLKAKPSDCLMIGNDLAKDMVSKEVGIPFFLVENEFTRLTGGKVGIQPDFCGGYEKIREILLP